MVEVELTKIIIDEKRQDQIIVLKEKTSDRQFPIVIGFMEASSIKMKIAGIEPPRPLTHDLLFSLVEALGGQIEYLLIDKMYQNTFHAKIKVTLQDGDEKIVDARPSDGIALAVRADVPIFVEEDVLDQVAMFNDI